MALLVMPFPTKWNNRVYSGGFDNQAGEHGEQADVGKRRTEGKSSGPWTSGQ